MGRSSRKQGQGRGCVFLEQKFLGFADSIDNVLRSLEENKVREGGLNVKGLYDKLPFLSDPQIKVACKIYDNEQWVASTDVFESNRKSDLDKLRSSATSQFQIWVLK